MHKPLYTVNHNIIMYLQRYGDITMDIIIRRIPTTVEISALIRNMDQALTKSGIDLVNTPTTYYDMPIRLHIWTDFCPDKTGGMAVALAETVDEAKRLIQAKHSPLPVWDWGTLTIHDIKQYATCIDGGK